MANSNLLLKGVSVLCVSLFRCVFCVFVAFFSLLVFSWCWCIWPLRATVPSWATKGYGLAYKGSSFLLLPLTLTIIYLFYRIRPETTDWDRELFSGVFMSLEVSVFLHSRLIFASRGVSPCWLADLLASLVRLRIYIYIFNAICGCWQCILKKVNKLFEKEKSLQSLDCLRISPVTWNLWPNSFSTGIFFFLFGTTPPSPSCGTGSLFVTWISFIPLRFDNELCFWVQQLLKNLHMPSGFFFLLCNKQSTAT